MGDCKFSVEEGFENSRCWINGVSGVECSGSSKDKEDCPFWRISFAIARTK